MRIGLLTTSFPRFEGDVAGCFVLGFARTLAARGHAVEVLAPEPSAQLPVPAWPGVELSWVPYLRPQAWQRTFYGAGVPDNLRGDPAAWLGLVPSAAALLQAARARRARWDAIVTHFGLPCGLIGAALRTPSRPHLAVLHSADVHLLARLPAGSLLAETLARGSDRLLFVSAEHERRFSSRLASAVREAVREACVVQPMGFERTPAGERNRDASRRAWGLDRFTLLTVARLVPVKGLVEAVEALRDRADFEWLIAGDGPERAALQGLAARARARIRLLGAVTGTDKAELLRAADAFVLPSRVLPSGRSEGVPTALLEAMDTGLPVVASNVGGIRELVEHGTTGLLFDPREPMALSRALDALRADPVAGRRMAERARARAARYEWRELGPRIESWLAPRATSRRDESRAAGAIRRAWPRPRY